MIGLCVRRLASVEVRRDHRVRAGEKFSERMMMMMTRIIGFGVMDEKDESVERVKRGKGNVFILPPSSSKKRGE